MSITPPELPVSYSRGFVVGQVIHAIADTAPSAGGDADRFPESRPATGSITFTPVDRTVRKVLTDPSTFVVHEAVTAQLGTTGELVDAQGEVGIWLVTGPYRVEFKLGSGASIPGFTIEVTAAHTPASPLDLVTVAPYTPPAGTTVMTLLVPAGPAEGQVLSWVSGALTWVSAPPPGAHTHAIADTEGLQAALDGKASSTHNHTGTYAPALGPDDNYVTDAEKAALHTHPAFIAQGATAAAARDAIGAGTSSLAIGTGAEDAKAGDYEPDLSGLVPTSRTVAGKALTDNITLAAADLTDFTEASQDIVGAMVAAAGGSYDDGGGSITLPAGGGGSATQVDIYYAVGAPGSQSSYTWTKPAGAKMIHELVIGGGGGGGSGYRGAAGSQRGGGGAGGGGAVCSAMIPADALPATVAVKVGKGGAGALGAATDTSNGGEGVHASSSSFLHVAHGGRAGREGIATGASPGGGWGGSSPGIPAVAPGTNGAQGGANGPGGNSTYSATGGPSGGGGGGGISTGDVAGGGGKGGSAWQLAVFSTDEAAAGTAPGGAGADGQSPPGFLGVGGGGGAANPSGIGGKGGDGGNYGGGGGGGGASLNGYASGAGGNGGDGIVIITTYF